MSVGKGEVKCPAQTLDPTLLNTFGINWNLPDLLALLVPERTNIIVTEWTRIGDQPGIECVKKNNNRCASKYFVYIVYVVLELNEN